MPNFADFPTDKYGNYVAMAFNRVVTNKRSRELLLNALTERSQLLSEMIDSRRDLNSECHYPETRDVTPGQYKDLYDRFSLANRVVECLPRESWQVAPQVYETSDPDTTTPFEKAWDTLQPTTHGQSWYIGGDNSASVWEYLMRADILAGIGHFGLLLMGVDDGRNLQEPIEGTITFNSQQFKDCFLLKEEEEAIRSRYAVNNKEKNLPLNSLELNYLDKLAEQRRYTVNALQERERQRDAKPWEVGYGNPSKRSSSLFGDATGEQQLYTGDVGTEAQYQQGYGMSGEAQYRPSAEGTDQQYFGVQFGPTEMPGKKVSRRKLNLLFLRPFDESLVQVVRYEWNINNPRFGMPVMYRITLNDPRELHSGVGLPMATVFVHWSRVIHVADNLGSSEIFGAPRMRSVLNNLLDLQKVYGASAEGYWQAALAGIVLETHPQLGGDVTIDSADVRDQLENYVNSLQRYLALTGMSAHTLAPTVGDPLNQVAVQIEAICIKLGIPVRIFKGSERGELASSQDDAAWNDRLKLRQNIYITPRIIVPFIDRLITIGVLPEPSYVAPEDMDEDQAGLEPDTTFPQEDQGEEDDGQYTEQDGVPESQSTLEDYSGRAVVPEDLEEASEDDDQAKPPAETDEMEKDTEPNSLGRSGGKTVEKDKLLTKNVYDPHEEDVDPDDLEADEDQDRLESTDSSYGEDFDPTTSDDQPNLKAQPTNKAKVGYHVEWPDLESNTELSKAQIAATKTQAMATYVGGNVESIMPLIEFFTHILGIEEDKARAIVQAAEEQQMEQQQEQAMQNPFTDQQSPQVDENGFPIEDQEQQDPFGEGTDDGTDGANPFEEPDGQLI
jgi:hypothetical protein